MLSKVFFALALLAIAETPPVNKQQAASGVTDLKKSSESFRLVARKIGPAVVNIKSTAGKPPADQQRRPGRRGGRGRNPHEGMDPFQEFFERFGSPFPFGMPESRPQSAMGSGVIIDKSGIVVTNNHVVENATEVLVTVPGQKVDIKAKILGTDPRTDLAVLKLEKAGEYPFAEWADSDQVEVGDWAIAVGSPFALGQSVTVGIVSAKGRNAQELGFENTAELIQTDAAINPGNSGGPLCDLEGRVMGVDTAIYTRSGGYMGIGFAVSSNIAKDIVGKLLKEGKVTRGWLGVVIQPLDPELAKELGIEDGVAINQVTAGAPAAAAGLMGGDVIVEVDGKPVKQTAQLQRLISGFQPGQKVKIKVISYADKKSRTVTVNIGKMPEDPQALRPGSEESGEGGQADEKLGAVLSEGNKKVVVEGVAPGSLADRLGLQSGDVITRINRKPVDSVATYHKLLKAAKKVYLEVKRGDRTLFYQFSLTE